MTVVSNTSPVNYLVLIDLQYRRPSIVSNARRFARRPDCCGRFASITRPRSRDRLLCHRIALGTVFLQSIGLLERHQARAPAVEPAGGFDDAMPTPLT